MGNLAFPVDVPFNQSIERRLRGGTFVAEWDPIASWRMGGGGGSQVTFCTWLVHWSNYVR